jgi:hypothetical protein
VCLDLPCRTRGVIVTNYRFCGDVHKSHIHVHHLIDDLGEGALMATSNRRVHKHFQLDAIKIKRAQKALRTKTETETIERALDLAISEHESNRLAFEANERFFKSGGEIKDVYGKLDS